MFDAVKFAILPLNRTFRMLEPETAGNSES
jgi:hypothetical protein